MTSTLLLIICLCALMSAVVVYKRSAVPFRRRAVTADKHHRIAHKDDLPVAPTAVAGRRTADVLWRRPAVDVTRHAVSFGAVDVGEVYHPVYPKWHNLVFDFAADVQLSSVPVDGKCIGWRQTGRCRPDGPLEPFFSRSCDEVISGPSGFCLCSNGARAHVVSCAESEAHPFTCKSQCQRAT
jgi:hypothetical protein